MSSVVSKFWRVAASRWSFTGFRKNKQTHLQACSGIRNISAGPTHEKMSLGHFSFSGCSCNLGRLRAVNPGNGDVPITPLQIAPAEVHLCPPGPRPSAGLTKGLSGFKSAQFPVLRLAQAFPGVQLTGGWAHVLWESWGHLCLTLPWVTKPVQDQVYLPTLGSSKSLGLGIRCTAKPLGERRLF